MLVTWRIAGEKWSEEGHVNGEYVGGWKPYVQNLSAQSFDKGTVERILVFKQRLPNYRNLRLLEEDDGLGD